ncbi:hypothetical protein KCP71_04790 [Salmonella enterica subsp. enterica]|nr:hypothetical protein KCP71_04790 [Salmonella enterica subsp. enterica]
MSNGRLVSLLYHKLDEEWREAATALRDALRAQGLNSTPDWRPGRKTKSNWIRIILTVNNAVAGKEMICGRKQLYA